ncbi:MAG: DUF6585 family protein [Polyangiales bacterium]
MSLGPVIRVYRQRFAYRFGLPLACLGLMAFAIAMVAAIHYMPEQFDAEYRDKSMLIMFAAPIVCAVLLVTWRRQRGTAVRVHEHGIAVEQAGRVDEARWDDIVEVWRSVFAGPFPAGNDAKPGYQLHTVQGTRLALPKTLEKLAALGGEIERRVAQRLLPLAQAHLAAGGELPLGAYALSRAGIAFRSTSMLNAMMGNLSADQLTTREQVPWQDITDITHDAQWIRLRRPGAKLDVYVGYNAVPNVPVVAHLIDECRRFQNARVTLSQ